MACGAGFSPRIRTLPRPTGYAKSYARGHAPTSGLGMHTTINHHKCSVDGVCWESCSASDKLGKSSMATLGVAAWSWNAAHLLPMYNYGYNEYYIRETQYKVYVIAHTVFV
jgi:hypothetical protein